MKVSDLIAYLSTQDPEALVVEEVPCSNNEYVEITAQKETVHCGVIEGRHSRRYRSGRGRIPCVVLTFDVSPVG